jgi:hypothetical protein
MASGYTLKELMEFMGHADLQMVNRYVKLLPQLDRHLGPLALAGSPWGVGKPSARSDTANWRETKAASLYAVYQ